MHLNPREIQVQHVHTVVLIQMIPQLAEKLSKCFFKLRKKNAEVLQKTFSFSLFFSVAWIWLKDDKALQRGLIDSSEFFFFFFLSLFSHKP